MTEQEKRHPIDAIGPWIALCAAVGLTASGEYQLAQLAGWGALIAGLLPTAVDIYVVIAIRAHRDVAGAIVMMIATNALYHLAAANLFGTDGRPGHLAWWLIVAVTAIAPMVMWRIHRIAPRRSEQQETAVPVAAQEAAPIATDIVPQSASAPATEAPQEPIAERSGSDVPIATETATEALQGDTESASEAAPKRPRKAARKRSATTPRAAAKDAIAALYDELGKRPVESEMVAALKAIKSPFDSSAFAKKIRAEIEREHPELAALGSPNVHPLTGTDA